MDLNDLNGIDFEQKNNERIISENEYNFLLYKFLDPNQTLTDLETRRMKEYEAYVERRDNQLNGASKGVQYSLNSNKSKNHNLTIEDDENKGAINAIIIVLVVLCIAVLIAFVFMDLI